MWRCSICYGAKSFGSRTSVLTLFSSVWAHVGFLPRCAAESVYTWDTATHLLQNKLPEQVRLRPESHSKGALSITRTETHDQSEHDTNSNHTCGQLCGTMSWTAERMEDNTETRKKKEAEKSKDIHDNMSKKKWNTIHQLQFDDFHPHERYDRGLEHTAR